MLYGSNHASHLSRALETRLVIEQAKGYLARHHRVSPEEAFSKLRAYARGSRRRLTAVAEDVVRRGLDVDRPRGEPDVCAGAG